MGVVENLISLLDVLDGFVLKSHMHEAAWPHGPTWSSSPEVFAPFLHHLYLIPLQSAISQAILYKVSPVQHCNACIRTFQIRNGRWYLSNVGDLFFPVVCVCRHLA